MYIRLKGERERKNVGNIVEDNFVQSSFGEEEFDQLVRRESEEFVDNNNTEWDGKRDGQPLDFVFTSDEECGGDTNDKLICKQLLKVMVVSSSENDMPTNLKKKKTGIYMLSAIVMKKTCSARY